MIMNNNWRQKLHLEPVSGWLNDPNGLCFFGGYYHVYFQYSPDSPFGSGDKCWGHWQSPDLLHWSFTGIVLRPDIPEDRNGVYSGCALPAGDVLHLFYTGNVKEDGDYDYVSSGREANVITVSTRNGLDMSAKKVLLRNRDYPDYCSCHVRDPKVWRDGNTYRMVLGARTLSDNGCVLFYSSADLVHWKFDKVVSTDNLGYMWECPDYFTFGGNEYLSISPQGVPHEKFRFQNVYSSGYLFMNNDTYSEWDCGFDFYAPQTFVTPDNRRLLFGWVGIGDIPYSNPTAELGWQHCLTVPREIFPAPDGALRQVPARELKKLRREEVPLVSGMTAELPFELCARTSGDFSLRFGDYLSLSYSGSVFTMRFTDNNVGCGRDVRMAELRSCSDLQIIADTSSVEVYLNSGEKVLSSRFYPCDSAVTLSFDGLCGSLFQLDGLEVKSHG
jgi:beta-fructofuranosidase